MEDAHKHITFSMFSDDKIFIVLTVLVVIFLIVPAQAMKPEYINYQESIFGAIIVLPLIGLWMQNFWNRIMRKIFPKIPSISYGVGLMLSIMITMLI